MSINKTRGFLYWLARILGDWQAISSGSSKKVARRIGRRAAGRTTSKALWKLFKSGRRNGINSRFDLPHHRTKRSVYGGQGPYNSIFKFTMD